MKVLTITAVLLQLISASAMAEEILKLENDVTVGSKTYVRWEDVNRIGKPIGIRDDEGYCHVDDGSNVFDNMNNARVLPAGSELKLTGATEGYTREVTTIDGKKTNITDVYAVVESARGKIIVGCSIDTHAGEINPYRLDGVAKTYLESIGIKYQQR